MSVAPSRVSGFGPKSNGAGRMILRVAGLQPHRPERSHAQPQRRRARPAIVEERHRAGASRGAAVERVGRVEDARLGLARHVADGQRSGCGGVGQRPAADRRRCGGSGPRAPRPAHRHNRSWPVRSALQNEARRGSWPCRAERRLGESGRGGEQCGSGSSKRKGASRQTSLSSRIERTAAELGEIQLQRAIQSTNGACASTNGGSGEGEQVDPAWRFPPRNQDHPGRSECLPWRVSSRSCPSGVIAGYGACDGDHLVHLARAMQRDVATRGDHARRAAREVAGQRFHADDRRSSASRRSRSARG